MEALSDILEDDFRIVTETSPEAAIRKIGGDPEIAVVLCDQRMPRMTGDQLLAEASQISAATRLLITGYADLQAVVRAVNAGKIFGYISKRSEERRVGKECVRSCRSRGSTDPKKNKTKN